MTQLATLKKNVWGKQLSVELTFLGKLGTSIMKVVNIFQSEKRADARQWHKEIRKQCLIIEDEAMPFTDPTFYHKWDSMGNDTEAVRLSRHSLAISEALKELRDIANDDVGEKAYRLHQSCMTVLMAHGVAGSTGSMELTGQVIKDIGQLRDARQKQLGMKRKR
ncbi:hypothetical protein HAV21_03505 [Paenarthrobacter sp. MSM-2-10-13]|uniref:hypothetical protein n=1 Tax=Paenarthrobacter sp. MSM-2-10-13 TaxID=2717318 RepID=UPI00141E7F2E|nr:hypothetical protein [Paenarthrobacter sp. MSM-2-10-13]NHW45964.1 hypothetical protein [Paenarthrobacter sp. MSM-2-10-13]